MDILYTVGTGSKWNNNELRYSLRSIAENGQNIDRVFLVGYKPDFVNDNVIHIPCGDVTHCAHKNIMYKITYAITHSNIGKHFLISSDDHFYVKPVDFNNLPLYYRYETIPARVEPEHMRNTYFHSLVATRQLLKSAGLTIYQTNPHCNTHFDVGLYWKNKNLFDRSMKLIYGGETNCIMGNLLVREGWKPQAYNDKKIRSFDNREHLIKKIGDVECISMYDKALECGFGDYLAERFPEKCKYEK